MFSFIKQKKMLDDLSNIKKKQLVKQSQTIIENKNKIQQIHQLDLTEAPKGSKAATKKKNSKPSSSSSTTSLNTSLNNSNIIEEKSTTNSDNSITENDVNVNLQNHLIKLAETIQGKDPELAEFYMRRFHLESTCSDSVSKHSSNYTKACQFCGHSFLDRNNGYHLAKQNSTKVVIKDVTKGDKLCSLNLKQFFTSKNEKMKWTHIVCCLCAPKDANNNVLTFKCKQCQKYLIIPFDKTIASQIIPTQKVEQKTEAPKAQLHQKEEHPKQEEKPSINTPSNSNNSIEKKNKKKNNSATESNPAANSQQKQNQKEEQDKKRKREDSTNNNNNNNNTANNNNSKKKKNKNSATSTSASDFLKLL